jgi:hypothetical protein
MPKRIVDLIERHAEELTARLVERIKAHRTTFALRKLDDLELGRRAHALYGHLGTWLLGSSDLQVEDAFRKWGSEARDLGVPLSDAVGVLLLTRRNLWEFVESEVWDSVLDLRQEIDLEHDVNRFFDRSVYFTVRGFEEGGERRGRPQVIK